MAEVGQQQPVFGYRNVDILKGDDNSLGIGSYGAVYKARCDDLLCAAKILHPTLFQSNDPGARRLLQKFEQECSFMNRVRHPNIVLFIGVWRDPQSALPVLLMELLDESLTTFLERSKTPLPFHVQVNFSHDIALALSYLHSNNIIHRDLSSNNVLLVTGSRAKVTDFGMSRVIATSGISRRFSRLSLTHCPGTEVYMPPEAIRNTPAYTNKLDCFSFGPLIIQIITRLFPDPGDRTRAVRHPGSPTGSIEMPVLETERRQSHIDLITADHPLLPIAVSCINYTPEERPSMQEVCCQLAVVKESPSYVESLQGPPESNESVVNEQEGCCDHERALEEKVEELRLVELEKKDFARQLQQHQREVSVKDEQLQEMAKLLQAKDQELEVAMQVNPQAKQSVVNKDVKQVGKGIKLPCLWAVSSKKLETIAHCLYKIEQDYTKSYHSHYNSFLEQYMKTESDTYFAQVPKFTFTFPTLDEYPPEFKQFTSDHLIDKETQYLLEGQHCLNWCPSTTPLVPLYTKQGGNSLPDAASLAMWGLDDCEYFLRSKISYALTVFRDRFKERFRQLYTYNYQIESETQLDPQQWEQEWQRIAYSKTTPGKTMDSLEEFHIFILSDILRRPIIVYSDCYDTALERMNYHGIYFPLERTPEHCTKDPLPLAYNGGHFSALVCTDLTQQTQNGYLTLPISNYYGQMFPVKYCLRSEDPTSLVTRYLDSVTVNVPDVKTVSPFLIRPEVTCAKLVIKDMPDYLKHHVTESVDMCYIEYVRAHQ